VLELRQTAQYEPQAEQYLTPSGEIVKKVREGQLQAPFPLGVARATQAVQLVADLQTPHPVAQGIQFLVASS